MPLTLQAPEGAHFDMEVVSNKAGVEFDVPILIWDDLDKAVAFYTEEGILNVLDGTSVRVQMQGIARRMVQGKEPVTEDDIAKAQVEYRPGQRRVGEATPASRTARAAKKAVEAKPEVADALAALLDRIASGKVSAEEMALLGQ